MRFLHRFGQYRSCGITRIAVREGHTEGHHDIGQVIAVALAVLTGVNGDLEHLRLTAYGDQVDVDARATADNREQELDGAEIRKSPPLPNSGSAESQQGQAWKTTTAMNDRPAGHDPPASVGLRVQPGDDQMRAPVPDSVGRSLINVQPNARLGLLLSDGSGSS